MAINSLLVQDVIYEIIQSQTTLNGEEIVQYGIKMLTVQGYYAVECISEELEIVQDLKSLLEQNDVDPITLDEVIEEYITELYTY